MASPKLDTAKPEPPTPQTIVVLGMHRSGTSAFTRTLNLLGADLPGRLMDPLPGVNDPGFWEPKDLVAINDEILRCAGSSWDDLAPFAETWYDSQEALGFRAQILEILRRDFLHSSLFALKDPRICRLVPFWISILEEFGTTPVFLIPLRNPLEVAASLEVRNNFSAAFSHLLWLRHVLDAEADTRGRPRFFVGFEDLMKDWRGVFARLVEELGIRRLSADSKAASQIDAFLSAKHHHHHFGSLDVEEDDRIPQIVKQAFAGISAATQRVDPPVHLFDRLRGELDQAERVFRPLIKDDRHRLKEARAAVRALKEGQPDFVPPLGGWAGEGLAGLYEEVERLSCDLTAANHRSEKLGEKLEEQGATLGRLGDELTNANTRLMNASDQLESAHAETKSLSIELEAKKLEVGRHQEELMLANRRLEKLGAAFEKARHFQEELLLANGRLEELGAAFEEKQALVEQLGSDLATSRGDVGRLEMELSGVRETLERKLVAFSELQSHAERLEKKLEVFRKIPLAGAAWRFYQRYFS